VLFLRKDQQGRALIIAKSPSKDEADAFGRAHLPAFCGESIELDQASRREAEEFWDVRTVTVGGNAVRPRAASTTNQWVMATHIFVRGPVLPDDVEADGLLTDEDRRDLTLDHIARTSKLVGHIAVVRRS
jgi:hypothetical protein